MRIDISTAGRRPVMTPRITFEIVSMIYVTGNKLIVLLKGSC